MRLYRKPVREGRLPLGQLGLMGCARRRVRPESGIGFVDLREETLATIGFEGTGEDALEATALGLGKLLQEGMGRCADPDCRVAHFVDLQVYRILHLPSPLKALPSGVA
jgi:hypothetical protein